MSRPRAARRRALVTGAAGFIGSHLAEALLAAGHEVLGVDNFDSFYPRPIKEDNLRALRAAQGFTLREGDITDREFVLSLAGEGGFDVVYHLAALAGVSPSLTRTGDFVKVNVEGTLNVLDLCRDERVGLLVFASSSSVYGARSRAPFHEDEDTSRPSSPYAATKAAGESLCHTYHHVYGLAVTCLRFFTVYGPRQRPEMAIHRFVRRLYRGEPLEVYGDGSVLRDFTYIDDIIDGVLRAGERGGGFRVYNLGESETIDLLSLIRMIGEVVGKEPDLVFQPARPEDMPLTHACVDLARRELGYRPNTALKRGLEAFAAWYHEHRAASDLAAGPDAP